MSALFSKSTRASKADKTVLLVDVENGSVGSALVRISRAQPLRLFGEHRVALPVPRRLSAYELAKHVDASVEDTLLHAGTVASRLRNHPATAQMGAVDEAYVFFSAPWTGTVSGDRGLRWGYEPYVLDLLRKNVKVVSEAPVSVHPFGKAAASAAYASTPGDSLLCIVTGEVVELVLVRDGVAYGRATIPLGLNTVVRTLEAHAGLTIPEAHSLLKLTHHTGDPTYIYTEPLTAASEHFAEEFADAAQELLSIRPVRTILVIAQEPVGEWFAKALTQHDRAASLFPDGGVVRALRSKHLQEYVAAHAEEPDLHLMIEAMFISAQPERA